MAVAVALDIYGTLVDPQQIAVHLRPLTGGAADRIAELWRARQLEYTFRRVAMGRYENFAACTRQALVYALDCSGAALSIDEQNALLERYQELPAFSDAASGLQALRDGGCAVWAFSNGLAANVELMLRNAALLDYFDGIVSTDEVQSFKPDPRVYQHFLARVGRAAAETWLISSNPFDVIGAKAAGLRAIWLKRNPKAIFDPWGIEADLTAANLDDAAQRLHRAA